MLQELRFFAFSYVKESVWLQTLFVETVMILIDYDSKKIKLVGKIFLFEFELLQFSKCTHSFGFEKGLQSILSYCVSKKTARSISSDCSLPALSSMKFYFSTDTLLSGYVSQVYPLQDLSLLRSEFYENKVLTGLVKSCYQFLAIGSSTSAAAVPCRGIVQLNISSDEDDLRLSIWSQISILTPLCSCRDRLCGKPVAVRLHL